MKTMKALLITVFFVTGLMLSSTAQQWSGNNNTTDPIVRTGKVGVGVTSPGAQIEVAMSDGFTSIFKRSNDNFTSNALFLLRRTRGTVGAESAVLDGDYIGQIGFDAYKTGGGYNRAAVIATKVDGTPGSTIPGYMEFRTRDGSGVMNKNMVIDSEGNIGMGTTLPQTKLAVNGNITCKEVEVTLTGWADYVFDEKYNLQSLEDVEHFVMTHGHLPGVPSAEEVESNGVKLGEMDATLLKKIEELTLHVIELNKRIKTLEER